MVKKRIFVACGFTWNNKGDAALLMAMAQAMRRAVEGAQLSFSSFTPELDSEKYGETVVRMPLDPAGRPSRWVHSLGVFAPILLRFMMGIGLAIFRIWLLLNRLIPASIRYRVLGPFAPTAQKIIESDLVIALPGGYLQALRWEDDYWLFHWLTLRMAKAAKKPVAIYAQSIGPFQGRHQIWAKQLLNGIDAFSVRETYSKQRLLEYGIPESRIAIVPDAAFGLTSSSRYQEEFDQVAKSLSAHAQPWTGVSVREHQFPGEADPIACMNTYLGEVAKAADRMIEISGGTVFFVPQCIKNGGRDLQVSQQVIDRMRHPHRAVIVDADLSPLALQHLYGQFEMLIGTRMHANILAMCAGTPVAAIAYERKTNGIMKMLDLDDFVIDIDAIIERLTPLVERVFAARQGIREHLKTAIPPIRDRSLETPHLLFTMLDNSAA